MKTLVLKQEFNKQYYLSGITEEQFELLKKHKIENTLKELNDSFEIPCENIIKIGEIKNAKLSGLTSYIPFMRGRDLGQGREIHFRNYQRTLQEQKDIMYLVNTCSSIMGARSALRALSTSHCILWYTKE